MDGFRLGTVGAVSNVVINDTGISHAVASALGLIARMATAIVLPVLGVFVLRMRARRGMFR